MGDLTLITLWLLREIDIFHKWFEKSVVQPSAVGSLMKTWLKANFG